MSALGDAVEFRERMNDEARRQIDMLRVTLNERVRECEQARMWRERTVYADVLSMLGPEPAWYTDPDSTEPF